MSVINSQKAKKFAKTIAEYAVYGVAVIALGGLQTEKLGKGIGTNSDYYEAVRAISESCMYASDKQELMAVIKRDGTTDYYKTVIAIANASMYASDKIALVKNLK